MQFNNLVHEEFLIASLSETWKARFEKAIKLMHDNLDQPFYWPDIAQKCASSPTHFHSMFRAVMGEPPATYHRRLRLKKVLFELYFLPEKTVTDIALDAGFSTVQSLAKVLKRELGKTAKQIRQENMAENYESLRNKVEHIIDDQSLEQTLSRTINFVISKVDKQNFYTKETSELEFKQLIEGWEKFAPKEAECAFTITPPTVVEDFSVKYKIGYQCSPAQANHHIQPQCYLTCHIKIKDTSSYVTSWEALYKEAIEQNYPIDEHAEILEIIHNPRDYNSLNSILTLMLPIKNLI